MKTNIIHLNIIFIALFFLNMAAATDRGSGAAPLIQKKNDLSRSLDSLDLIKQNKKRQGHSFSEIEQKQKEILDSLQFIRKKIQTSISSTNQGSPVDKSRISPFETLSLNHWITLITVIAVLFTGIWFLFGMTKKIVLPEPKKKYTGSQRTGPAQPDLCSSNENLEKTDLYSDNHVEKLPSGVTTDQFLTQIEEKSQDQHIETISEDLEARVIKAASEKMCIQEISRLFHLSSDHVSLILRLAESKKEQNRSE